MDNSKKVEADESEHESELAPESPKGDGKAAPEQSAEMKRKVGSPTDDTG